MRSSGTSRVPDKAVLRCHALGWGFVLGLACSALSKPQAGCACSGMGVGLLRSDGHARGKAWVCLTVLEV